MTGARSVREGACRCASVVTDEATGKRLRAMRRGDLRVRGGERRRCQRHRVQAAGGPGFIREANAIPRSCSARRRALPTACQRGGPARRIAFLFPSAIGRSPPPLQNIRCPRRRACIVLPIFCANSLGTADHASPRYALHRTLAHNRAVLRVHCVARRARIRADRGSERLATQALGTERGRRVSPDVHGEKIRGRRTRRTSRSTTRICKAVSPPSATRKSRRTRAISRCWVPPPR